MLGPATPRPETFLSTDAVESHPPVRNGWSEGAISFGAGLALVGIGAAMLHLSWGHWPDVLVDFGRELYLPWRISEGDVLYRDVRHLSGPLSPYWNALGFHVFGVGLRTLVWMNVALIALMVLLLHGLLQRIAGWLSAFVGCAVVLVAFAFGQLDRIGNYNYVTPYAHEITHGLVLSLGILSVLGARARLGDRAYAVVGLLLGLVALTKAEILLAIGGGVGVFAVLELRAEAVRGGPVLAPALGRFGLLALGVLVAPALALFLLGCVMPLGDALQALADPWIFATDPAVRGLDFYRRGMGTLAPLESLARIARWGVGWTLFVGAALGLALRLRVGRRAALAVGAVAAAGGLLVFGPEPDTEWLWITTPLPLAALVGLFIAGLRGWRSSTDASEVRLRAAFAVFATLLTAKVFLRTALFHYGFALAMPIAMMAVAALCDWIPAWVDRRGGRGALVRGAALGGVVVLLTATTGITLARYERHRQAVGSGADAFVADARGFYVNALLTQLRDAVPAEATLLVLPEGVMINYLARRRNPTAYVNFMPPEILLFGEDQILGDFERNPPDYVALVQKRTLEYGLPFFGVDYARGLRAFVDRHYRVVSQIGDVPFLPDTTFGITLHRRIAPKAKDSRP